MEFAVSCGFVMSSSDYFERKKMYSPHRLGPLVAMLLFSMVLLLGAAVPLDLLDLLAPLNLGWDLVS